MIFDAPAGSRGALAGLNALFFFLFGSCSLSFSNFVLFLFSSLVLFLFLVLFIFLFFLCSFLCFLFCFFSTSSSFCLSLVRSSPRLILPSLRLFLFSLSFPPTVRLISLSSFLAFLLLSTHLSIPPLPFFLPSLAHIPPVSPSLPFSSPFSPFIFPLKQNQNKNKKHEGNSRTPSVSPIAGGDRQGKVSRMQEKVKTDRVFAREGRSHPPRGD